jgi:predicted dehydrogenase
MNSAPLNVALIGYGYAGKTFHAPLISAVPGLRLAVVSSRDSGRVHADWPDVVVVSDPQAAVSHAAVDLVVIASPNDSHAPLAMAALQAGKHVVVDKPFTVTVAEGESVIAEARKQGRVLSVFQSRRWDSDFLTLKTLIADGTLGEVLTFESRLDRWRPIVRPRWREQAGPGGGLWYDLGPHLIDQALHLFGPPRAVSLARVAQRPGAVVDDWFAARLDYGRLQVSLGASMLMAAPTPRFSVHGTKASWLKYGVDSQEASLKEGMTPGDGPWGVDTTPGLLYRTPEDNPLPTEKGHGDYRAYYRQVASAIREGAANPVPAEEALAVMRIIESALPATRTLEAL